MKRVIPITERNKGFSELSPAGKRVAVARDVIAQLDEGAIKAQRGLYFSRRGRAFFDEDDNFVSEDAPRCSACAVGSMMVSVFGTDCLKHEEDVSDVFWECRNQLEEVFGSDQLALIENHFEGRRIRRDPWDDGKFTPAIRGLADKVLRAIMQNIIDHRGTFRPEKMKS